MKREILESLIAKNYTQREMAESEGVSQSTIKHWLKKYDLKTLGTRQRKTYVCECGEDRKEEFYKCTAARCKKCYNIRRAKRQKNVKLKIIDYMGGGCSVCGYNEYHGALDIHHLDPNLKSDSFDSIRSWTWDKIVKELETCVLLCSNHHAEAHRKD